MKKIILTLLICLNFNITASNADLMNPTIGEIAMFSGDFAPRGWAFCNGQVLPISSNPSLYSIIGKRYGGNGKTTFALPDLRGRAAIHVGGGHKLGDNGGKEQASLSTKATKSFSYNTVQYIIAITGIHPSR